MPKINVLPKHIADLIAAGEVVERPSSVIKELMENAIDAGADSITVEIRNGGITYMRVTDNGCGIHREDIRNAFKSHATSKIVTEDDLHKIGTLGFRGEALASIAAVSRVDILTRTPEDEIGTVYKLEGSEEVLLDDAGCPLGTTIAVKDLFYNTPARMKFLKKDVTEGNSVAGVVDRLALSHPDISFRFIRDDRQQLATTGNGKLSSAVYSVFGKEFASGLLETSYELNGVKVEGMVSRPTASRSNRSMQFFFLNGRLVKSMTARAALEQAYKNAIMVGRFPACVLNIYVPLDAVDVNVHPAKTEVRFANEKPIFDAVYYAAKNAIEKKDKPTRLDLSRMEAKRANTGFRDQPSEQLAFGKKAGKKEQENGLPEKVEGFWSKELPDDYRGGGASKKSKGPVPFHPVSRGKQEQPKPVEQVKPAAEPKTAEPAAPELTVQPQVEEPAPVKEPAPAPAEQPKPDEAPAPVPYSEQTEVPDFRIIGEAFKTYILVETEGMILLIDKHAAHERILFERFKSERGTVESQVLLAPLAITCSKEEYNALLENKDVLSQAGFDVDDFGAGTIVLREVPVLLINEDLNALIQEMAGYLLESSAPTPDKLGWLYANTACRAAIKAGDNTSPAEQKELVEYLLSHRDIRYCPHGRPITIEMTRADLEKEFGRIQ